jgi:hypothetical protein
VEAAAAAETNNDDPEHPCRRGGSRDPIPSSNSLGATTL